MRSRSVKGIQLTRRQKANLVLQSFGFATRSNGTTPTSRDCCEAVQATRTPPP